MAKRKRKRHLKAVPKEPTGPAPTISLCMIVRNEEENLSRALGSVEKLVDEMVVVDTGSTDRTVEIAESHGAKVVHSPWEDSFSQARNVSLMNATKDWILVLDADEYIEPSEHRLLRQTVRRDDIDIALCPNINTSYGNNEQTGVHYNPRIFRNRKEFFYFGRVHNQLNQPGRAEAVPIRIIHTGYGLPPEEMQKKWTRTKALLHKVLDEDPVNAFQHYNLCVCLNNLQEFDAGIIHAGRTIALAANGTELQQMGRYMRALMTRAFGDIKSSIRDLRAALAEDPQYVDALYMLAECLLEDHGDCLEIVTLYERYLHAEEEERLRPKGNLYILNCIGLAHIALFNIGNLHVQFGAHQRALSSWETSLKVQPEPAFKMEIYSNMGQMFMAQQDWEKVIWAYEKVLEAKPDDGLSWNNIGVAWKSLGDQEKAEAAFRKALEVSPGLDLPQRNLTAMGVSPSTTPPSPATPTSSSTKDGYSGAG